MTAYDFLLAAIGGAIVALVWLAYYIRHACDELAVPDCHGDVPAIPEELIEKAIVESRIRNGAQAYAAKAVN